MDMDFENNEPESAQSEEQDFKQLFLDYEAHEKKRRRSTRRKIIIAVIATALITASFTAVAVNHVYSRYGAFISENAAGQLPAKLSSVKSVLDTQYLYDYDENELDQGAVKGYIEALDEPYTHYYSPDEFKSYTEELQDSYVGIGVVVTVNEKEEIQVIAPFEGSSAYEAGVKPGDILKAVDGEEFDGAHMQDAVNKIKGGESGTFVTLTFARDGGEPFDLSIERKIVETESVSGEMLGNGIGYINISEFAMDGGNGKDTYTEFRECVDNLNNEGMRKLIIDLRDNPGGALDIACDIADMIVPEGVITYMEYKDGTRQDFNSDVNEMDIPIVILINGNSASASEVLTGCLKDYGKATVVGSKSYGKGIVQTIYPFRDGSGLSMTVAKYYSPSGVCIHGTGIEPDITVDVPEEYEDYYASSIPKEEDAQLQKAIDLLSNAD